MKLSKDFGVRGLLATISGVGFYGLLALVFIRYNLGLPTIIALVTLASAAFMTALNWYFSSRQNILPTTPPTTPQ